MAKFILPVKQLSVRNINIATRIHLLRKEKVILDHDLALLYGVKTKALKQAVKRNKDRFPEDFMFELTHEEHKNLRSQIVTSSWGGTRYRPMAFTEHGVAMLSSVLKSRKAIEIHISIVRAFVWLRKMILSNKDLFTRFTEFQRTTNQKFMKQDETMQGILGILKHLIAKKRKPRKPIGFRIGQK